MRLQVELNIHSLPQSDISISSKNSVPTFYFSERTGKAPMVSAKEEDKDDFIVLGPHTLLHTFWTFYFYWNWKLSNRAAAWQSLPFLSWLWFLFYPPSRQSTKFLFLFYAYACIITSYYQSKSLFSNNGHSPPALVLEFLVSR